MNQNIFHIDTINIPGMGIFGVANDTTADFNSPTPLYQVPGKKRHPLKFRVVYYLFGLFLPGTFALAPGIILGGVLLRTELVESNLSSYFIPALFCVIIFSGVLGSFIVGTFSLGLEDSIFQYRWAYPSNYLILKENTRIALPLKDIFKKRYKKVFDQSFPKQPAMPEENQLSLKFLINVTRAMDKVKEALSENMIIHVKGTQYEFTRNTVYAARSCFLLGILSLIFCFLFQSGIGIACSGMMIILSGLIFKNREKLMRIAAENYSYHLIMQFVVHRRKRG